jgi:hypothetical protein
MGTPLLLRFLRIDPRLSWQLILISAYLCLIGLANTMSFFHLVKSGDQTSVITTGIAIILHFVPAFGILTLRPWGRRLEIGISAIALVISVALFFSGEFFWGMVIVVIHGSILRHLLSKSCKALFASVS